MTEEIKRLHQMAQYYELIGAWYMAKVIRKMIREMV